MFDGNLVRADCRIRRVRHLVFPAEPAMALTPQAMALVLRRRLRIPLPICHGRCGPTRDRLGDQALACHARSACQASQRAWVRVARGTGGAKKGRWGAATMACEHFGVRAGMTDAAWMWLVIDGAMPNGSVLSCDAKLV